METVFANAPTSKAESTVVESYFVFPDKTIEYIKGAQFDRQILEMTKNKIEKIYRLPEADVNRFAEVINEY